MPDIDYDPVTTPEDEEERRRRDGDYPPAEPARSYDVGALTAAPPVPPSLKASDEIPVAAPAIGAPGPIAQRGTIPQISSAPAPEIKQPRPQWSEYAPVQKSGWGRVGQTLGEMFLGTQSKAERRAENAYKNATAEYEAPLKEAQQEAQTGEITAKGEEERARAESLKNPQPKEGLTPEEKFMTDALHGNNGQPKTDEQGKPYTYLSAHAAWKQAEQDTKPEKGITTREITRVVGGVPHTIMVNAQTGEDIKDEGQTKLPGESAADKRAANESAQVERESRQNIRKAEGQYRDTQKSVGQLVSAIDAAKDGNGLLTSFVPTMEVLGINAANGVHRISPAEAHAANLPGGWAERFNAWFDKAATGKTSPELVTEGKALAKILLKSSYDRYKSTYSDEHGIVTGYGGKDFDKRVPLIKEETYPGDTISYSANGKTYNIPADQEKEFLKDHPNAQKQ